MSVPQEIYREQFGEYVYWCYWCKGVKGVSTTEELRWSKETNERKLMSKL